MKAELYKRISETESKYVKCFSECIKEPNSIRFEDEKLMGMFMHNFIFLKELMDKDQLMNFIKIKLEEAKMENKDYLHFKFNYDIEFNDLESMIPEGEITKSCFMAIEPKNFNKLKMKDDCYVLKADTLEILEDGKLADIEANKAAMGESFVKKRIERKIEAYKKNPGLNLYVCYKGKTPIGKCELFIEDGIAKIEDFDIIEEYQEQGHGTAVLRKLLEVALNQGADIAYLTTDYFETAKDMYKKCGLSIVGFKTSILFDF